MTDRAKFESAMIALHYPENMFEGFDAEDEYTYYDPKANVMYDAWKAAKAQELTFSVNGEVMSQLEYIDHLQSRVSVDERQLAWFIFRLTEAYDTLSELYDMREEKGRSETFYRSIEREIFHYKEEAEKRKGDLSNYLEECFPHD